MNGQVPNPLPPPMTFTEFMAHERWKLYTRQCVAWYREYTYDWWIHNANETRPADVFFAQEGHPPRGDTEYERIVAVVDVFNAVTPVEKQMLVLWAQQHRSRGTPLIWFVVLPWYAF